MSSYKNIIYALLCLSLSIIIGAGVYEHIAVFPRAFAAPPKSLMMFQGEYGTNPGAFWKIIHPVTLLLFIITLTLSWKTERRKNVLIPLIIYAIILIATFIYFVPELMALVTTKYENVVNPDLVERGSRWQVLSLMRLCVAIAIDLFLFLGLTKPHHNDSK